MTTSTKLSAPIGKTTEPRDNGPAFQPNPETASAMLEAERLARAPKVKRYHSAEEALKALKE